MSSGHVVVTITFLYLRNNNQKKKTEEEKKILTKVDMIIETIHNTAEVNFMLCHMDARSENDDRKERIREKFSKCFCFFQLA